MILFHPNNTSSASVTSTSSVADLYVEKKATTANGDAVLDNNEESLTYTITVKNLDNISAPLGATLDNATNVTFTDAIPARYSGTAGTTGINVSYSPLSAGFLCSVSGSNVTCSGGTVNLGESVIFTITVSRPLRDGNFTNTASAYSQDVGDPDRTNNAGSVDVTIEPVADVTITGKTVLPNPVKEGVNATYTISIRNNGPSAANNVVVTDVFDPADTDFVFISASATEGSCSYNPSSYTLTCNGITLSNNESKSISLTIIPNYTSDTPSRNIENTANITTTTTESNYNNNEDNATLNVEVSDLDILVNKVELSTLYDPIGFDPTDRTNNIIIYKVDITNQGPSLATGIILTDLMTPKNGKTLKFLCDQVNATDNCDNNTSQNANYCDHQGNNVTGPGNLSITCYIPDNLSANQSLSHYLLFEVITAPDPSGDTHFNLASVSPNEVDRNVANDNESETTTVLKRVDLSLSKTPNDNQVSILQPFNWTIVVTNNGPGDSDNTTVTDTVPNGLEILSTPLWSTTNGTPSNGNCSVVGQSITCNFGMLEATKIATITVPVRAVQYPLSGSVTNCATATTDQLDPISGNNITICSQVNVVKSDIKGYVYEDLNNNGIQDGSEIGIDNVTVTLSGTDSYGNNVNIVIQTDSNGNFVFDNLSPSDENGYAITETHPVSYFDGIDNVTGEISGFIGNDIFTEVNLKENQSLSYYTFGEIPKSSIAGNVWHDVDNDGTFDNFESEIAGVTITLTGIDWFNQPVSRTTTTGTDGSYSFGDLWPSDNYTVTETQPSGWIDGKDSVGDSSGTLENDVVSSIVLPSKTNYNELNFGELLIGTISGFVYIDLDNDAFKDDNETTMLGGIEIILTGTNDLGASVYYQTTTDSNGFYIFTGLRPGNYTVTETKPALPATGSQVGSLGGNPGSDQTTQFTNSIILSSDNSGINYNFGHLGGSVEVTIYDDKDKDGLFDPNVDIPLSGVSVKVTDSAGNEYTVVTEENGFASQLVPPGQTIVDVDGSTLSPFYKLTIDDHGHGNDPTTVDVPLGGVGEDFNGYKYLPPVAVPLMGDFAKYIFALLLFFSRLIFLRKKL